MTADREKDEAGRRPGIGWTTQRNAIAGAAVQLQMDDVDVEVVLQRLFDIGREQGRLQGQEEMNRVRLEAAQARERATRYSSHLTRIRAVAYRLREDGQSIHKDVVDAIWPKEIG